MDGYQQYSRYGAPRQGQGFYNPYMKTPDWGQGANRLGEILMQMYAMKTQQKEQKRVAGIQEREMKLAEEREQRLARGELTERDYRSLYGQYMMSSGQWNQDDNNAYIATGNVPKRPVKYSLPTMQLVNRYFSEVTPDVFQGLDPEEQGKYVQEAFKQSQPTTEKENPKITQAKKLTEKAIADYKNELLQIQEAMVDPYAEKTGVDYRMQIANLQNALQLLQEIDGRLYTYNIPLTQTENKLLNKLYSRRNQIKDKGIFWEQTQLSTDTPKLTTKGTVLFQGVEYPLNPDGTVTINGVTYQIKKK